MRPVSYQLSFDPQQQMALIWVMTPYNIQVDKPRVCNCPDDQRLVGLFVVYAYA
jgi:hypothetical protein